MGVSDAHFFLEKASKLSASKLMNRKLYR